MKAFTLHADCSYALLEGSREYLPPLQITRLQIEKAYRTVREHSVCSHPLALVGEAESLLLWLHVVLSCMAPLPRAGARALGLKTLSKERLKAGLRKEMLQEVSLAETRRNRGFLLVLS